MTRWSIGNAVRSGLAALALGLIGATSLEAQQQERPFLCETPTGIQATAYAQDCDDIRGVVFPEDTIWAAEAYQELDGRRFEIGTLQQPSVRVAELDHIGYRLMSDGAEVPIRAHDPQGRFLGNATMDFGDGQRVELNPHDQETMQRAGWREVGDGVYTFNPAEALLVSESGRTSGQTTVRFHIVSEDHPSTRVGGCFVVGTPKQLSSDPKLGEVDYAPKVDCNTPFTEFGTPPPEAPPVVVLPPPEEEGPYSFIAAGPAFKKDFFNAQSNFAPDICWDGSGLALTLNGQYKSSGLALNGSGLYASLNGECQGGVEKDATVMEGYANLVVGEGLGVGVAAEGVDIDIEDRGLSIGHIGAGPAWRSGDFAVSAGPAYFLGEDDEYSFNGFGGQAFVNKYAGEPESPFFSWEGLGERIAASGGVHYYDVGDTEGYGGRGQLSLRLANIGPVALTALGGFTLESLCHDEDGTQRYLNDRTDMNEDWYAGLQLELEF